MDVSVEEAIGLIRGQVPRAGEELVPLLEAEGRVLSRELRSCIEQPPFDRSPLDGYAVRAEDVRGASKEAPRFLRVVDKLFAGGVSQRGVNAGEAVRLMTGAMMPAGTDCVIRQEDTDEGEETVAIFEEARSSENFCCRGEEYGAGELLIPAGSLLDAAALAVAAGAGASELPVRRRLRAAVFSTGDEVVQPGRPLPPGKIYDTNISYIAARLKRLGVEVVRIGSVGDDAEAIRAVFEENAPDVDLILTTGGVSVGQKDLIERAILDFGAQLVFHGVDMKPGMPTLFAVRDGVMLLGLSGNPFSAAVPFELFLREILACFTGCGQLGLRRGSARAGSRFGKRSMTRRFLRAYCENGVVTLPSDQSNGQMRSMIGCNCLVDVAEGTERIEEGETVDLFWI